MSTASFVSGSTSAPPNVGQVAVPISLRNAAAGELRMSSRVLPYFDAQPWISGACSYQQL